MNTQPLRTINRRHLRAAHAQATAAQAVLNAALTTLAMLDKRESIQLIDYATRQELLTNVRGNLFAVLTLTQEALNALTIEMQPQHRIEATDAPAKRIEVK